MIYIYVFIWIEKFFFHQLHILDFQMLSIETRNQGKKNGNVVRTYIWIRPVESINLLNQQPIFNLSFQLQTKSFHWNNNK